MSHLLQIEAATLPVLYKGGEERRESVGQVDGDGGLAGGADGSGDGDGALHGRDLRLDGLVVGGELEGPIEVVQGCLQTVKVWEKGRGGEERRTS